MYYIVGACQVGVEHARREGRQSRRKEENINCGSLPAQIASLEPALRMVSIEDIWISVFHQGSVWIHLGMYRVIQYQN